MIADTLALIDARNPYQWDCWIDSIREPQLADFIAEFNARADRVIASYCAMTAPLVEACKRLSSALAKEVHGIAEEVHTSLKEAGCDS